MHGTGRVRAEDARRCTCTRNVALPRSRRARTMSYRAVQLSRERAGGESRGTRRWKRVLSRAFVLFVTSEAASTSVSHDPEAPEIQFPKSHSQKSELNSRFNSGGSCVRNNHFEIRDSFKLEMSSRFKFLETARSSASGSSFGSSRRPAPFQTSGEEGGFQGDVTRCTAHES